jgi:ATP-dependent RNA helicase DDX23/PRP28
MQAIPIGLSHRDLMAIAPTGEGKTLAYLLPIIQFILPLERLNMESFESGPYAMVVVPTRELAEQIYTEFVKVTRGMGLRAFVAVGGYQFELQAIELAKGCEVIIATPGRAKEFIEKHHLNLDRLAWCVVDEADKMVS